MRLYEAFLQESKQKGFVSCQKTRSVLTAPSAQAITPISRSTTTRNGGGATTAGPSSSPTMRGKTTPMIHPCGCKRKTKSGSGKRTECSDEWEGDSDV